MDIKSKNINEEVIDDIEMKKDYTRITIAKIIAMIIAAMLFSVIFISIDDIKSNKINFDKNGVYSSQYVGSDLHKFTERVGYLTEFYKNEDYIKDKKNLAQWEIKQKKDSFEEQLNEEYSSESNKISANFIGTEQQLAAEQSKIRQELEKKYERSDEELASLIIEEKLSTFKREVTALSSYPNLKYISYDKKNNIWLSNFKTGNEAIEELKNSSRFFGEYSIIGGGTNKKLFIDGEYINRNKDGSIFDYVAPNFGYGDLSELIIYIGIPKELSAGDEVYSSFQNFNEATAIVNGEVKIFIGSLIGLIIMVFILRNLNKKVCYMSSLLLRLKHTKIEIKGFILMSSWIIYNVFYHYNYYEGYRFNININNIVLLSLLAIVWYLVFKALIMNYKDNTVLKDSYTLKLWEYVKIVMEKGSFGKTIFIIMSLYVMICVGVTFVLAGIFGNGFGIALAFMFDVVATLVVIYVLFKEFAYLNKIIYAARMLSEGKLNDNIEEQGHGALKGLAHSINNLKQGLRKSIENETKSERMKTELISNVSHDLKTPLTSIINYVDILKKQNIEPEEARAYLEVLDKKSQRLKLLIEDLFEASKAASGAMELTLTKVEVNALLNQTLGEAEGRIKESALDFKVNMPSEKIYIEADGRKIWRVFENLISNIIKYSFPNTRVYIDVNTQGENVYITMKNISAYELNFDVEEITERFKRGDESRHTDGSGLGLAISKSIVELHGGKFNIEIDGDLFKVIVELRISK